MTDVVNNEPIIKMGLKSVNRTFLILIMRKGWVDSYTVLDSNGECKTYHMWFHDYFPETITEVLNNSGFRIKHIWNSFISEKYKSGGDWIAIVAQKV